MKWIKTIDQLPEIGERVLVHTEYESITPTGNIEMHDIFVGYMKDDGELYTLPEDDSYGWDFEECVTHWCKITPP